MRGGCAARLVAPSAVAGRPSGVSFVTVELALSVEGAEWANDTRAVLCDVPSKGGIA